MTVAELIERLKEFAPELTVDLYSDLDGWDDIHFVQLIPGGPGTSRVRLSSHSLQPLIDALNEGESARRGESTDGT